MAQDDFVKVGLWTATTHNWMEEPVLLGMEVHAMNVPEKLNQVYQN
jgi:hypothetical protein